VFAQSNNGDRKIAIVIDSSGSMASSDPYNLRLTAGKQLNDWLISNKESSGGKKADQVSVINFSDSATVDYNLGDPGNADSSFNGIGADGGTFIAGGVQQAIEQLTGSSSGSTQDRSGIVVFTDGEDSDTPTLVQAINNATSLGIRVSFGFLDASASIQDPSVLLAVHLSGGQYNTIFNEASSQGFINLVIQNGITHNDNPAGTDSTLLAGLSASRFFISGSSTLNVQYDARKNEAITFTIQSYNVSSLDCEAKLGGKSLDKTSIQSSGTLNEGTGSLFIKMSKSGQINIQMKATNAEKDALVVIGAKSNAPLQNCTIGIGKASTSGLSDDGKKALAITIPPLVGIIALLGFFVFKFLKAPVKVPLGGHAAGGYPGGAEAKVAGDVVSNLGIAAAGAAAGGAAHQAAHQANQQQQDESKHKFKRFKRRKHKKHHDDKCEKKCYKDEKKLAEHDRDIENQRLHKAGECDKSKCEYCEEEKGDKIYAAKTGIKIGRAVTEHLT
jgi:hypothetical protein